jgi:hypothetical protein
MIGRGLGVHGARIACDGIRTQPLIHLERVAGSRGTRRGDNMKMTGQDCSGVGIRSHHGDAWTLHTYMKLHLTRHTVGYRNRPQLPNQLTFKSLSHTVPISFVELDQYANSVHASSAPSSQLPKANKQLGHDQD